MTPVRIFLADDHALLRDGVRAVLERQPAMAVVGEAGDGRETLKGITETHPDLAVIDIAMPEMNGIDALRQIRKVAPEVKVLVLSMYDDQDYVDEVLRAGASGYVLKDLAASYLVAAIEAVARGECFLCPAIASKIVGRYVRSPEKSDRPDRSPELTAREREVLQLVVEGHTNQETAERLEISPKTVEVHRYRIAGKLGIRDLPGLVKYAIRKGLIKP